MRTSYIHFLLSEFLCNILRDQFGPLNRLIWIYHFLCSPILLNCHFKILRTIVIWWRFLHFFTEKFLIHWTSICKIRFTWWFNFAVKKKNQKKLADLTWRFKFGHFIKMQSILLIIKKHLAFIISTSTFIINTSSNFYQTKTRNVFVCWNCKKKMIRLHHFQNPEERLFVIHFHLKQQFKDLF